VRDGVHIPVQRFQCVTLLNADTGAIEAISLWAGESVAGVRRMQPVASIVRELAGEAERLLERGPAVVQGAIG